MANREDAKQERREAILRAARELIGGHEKTRFSMSALAKQAGVSLATPYNLIGSKKTILQTLLDEDIKAFAAQMQRRNQNELDAIFDTVSQGTAVFARDQGYYRAVMSAVYQEGGRDYRSAFRAPRRTFWHSLVENALRAGYLSTEVESEPFSINLASIYFSHILEWVSEEIDLDDMETRTRYGFGLALLAVARPKHRKALHDLVMAAQAPLVQKAETPARRTRRTANGR